MHPLSEPRCCPHCGNTTPHELLFECAAPLIWYGDNDIPSRQEDQEPGQEYALIRCLTCRDLSLYSNIDVVGWQWPRLEYPSNYDLDPCVPLIISANYKEARRVQNISPNAFAVLIRRALEALCYDRGLTKGTLASCLKELASKGEIPDKLVEASSVLRELGNAGAHHSIRQVTIPMTWAMDSFFRTLIEYVYVAPSKMQKFQQSLERSDKSGSGAAQQPLPVAQPPISI